MPLHSTLTDSDGIHEPKGISTAANGTTYVANGSGSGSWTPRQLALSTRINDISVADVVYVPIPYAGRIVKVVTSISGPIAGANDTLTVANSSGASMGTITITQVGSAAGDIDTLTPVSNNTVSADSFITVASDGASNTARICFITIILERT